MGKASNRKWIKRARRAISSQYERLIYNHPKFYRALSRNKK